MKQVTYRIGFWNRDAWPYTPRIRLQILRVREHQDPKMNHVTRLHDEVARHIEPLDMYFT